MPNGLIKELPKSSPSRSPSATCAGRPVLSGVLRFETVRALARIVTLGALDLAGLFLAIYTALSSRPRSRRLIRWARCGGRRSTSRSARW